MPHTAKDVPPVMLVVQSGQVMPTDTWGRLMAYCGKETVPKEQGAFEYLSMAEHNRLMSQAYETGYKHGLSAGESAAAVKAESAGTVHDARQTQAVVGTKTAPARSAAELLAKMHQGETQTVEHHVGEAQPEKK